VPVYFLDTDLPENTEGDRALTHSLYGGDQRYRLCQEVVLGRGGVRMLRALGYQNIERFHMNEGHAALLTLELLDEEIARAGRASLSREDIEAVRAKCVFTTHTPVPAGHDQFPLDLVTSVVGPRQDFLDFQDAFTVELMNRVFREHRAFAGMQDLAHSGLTLNMTYMALNCSRYVNGVAKKHGEVAGMMFAGYQIDAITNGVHAGTWAAKPFQDLFDKHIPAWRQDNFSLRYALSIPALELWQAHLKAKHALIQYANRETNAGLQADAATVGFARRAAPYKRADLLFADLERLKSIAEKAGPLQIVYAGKAHPQDHAGKETIQRIYQARDALRDVIRIAYLENYDMALGKLITAGVDMWLNTPQRPLEASGTSGMKAALNGVPSLSILDGWWIEGHIEGVTGWAIGESQGAPTGDTSRDVGSLYDKLEHVVLPLFYGERERYVDIMRHAIALNGSFFNTQRMLQQYVLNAYFR
jgi:starch phosphorylase